MDSRPIGSNKLLEIKTEFVTFIIKGKKKSCGRLEEKSKSLLAIKGVNVREVLVDGYPIYKGSQDGFIVQRFSIDPMFFEQTDYEVVIQSKYGNEMTFWHENSKIRDSVSYITDDGNLMTGIINFRNDVGFSEFEIGMELKKGLTVRIEVYPTKISYKEDYQRMLQDISEEVYAVAIDFLKQTYQNFSIENNGDTIPAVFFQMISRFFGEFVRAANRIITVPYHKLEKEYSVQPFYKIKRSDNRTKIWLEKHPEYVQMNNGRVLVAKAFTVNKHVTYNTLENQFVKHILLSTSIRLADFKKRYQENSKEQEAHVLKAVDSMINTINRLVNESFLKDVGRYHVTQSMSLVFEMAPGYRELYKYYLILKKGLTLHGDVFRISLKDTAQLYEYWCFIKLVSIMKKHYKLISPDVIKVDNTGITVTLVKGKKSAIRFINPQTGEKIVLAYNPKEQQTQTVNQKPDNVLTLEKNGSDVPYKYVFDAKYKIETNLPNDYYPDVNPGPKVEDINTMHRYRDSIVYDDKTMPDKFRFEKTMFGAYILFPYDNEQEYKEHRFYKSIETVNIGGLPFLPGHTQLVELFLSELISDSDESAFERALLPRGMDKKLEKVDWERKDVLVGSLGSIEQLQKNLEGNFYYAPAKYISDVRLPIRYVAIYQSKTKGDPGIRYYGEVIAVSKVARKEIKEVPVRKGNPEEEYYYFIVKEWKQLKKSIAIKTERVYEPKFTNLFLLQNSTDTYELFNINSESEYRLLQELKRAYHSTFVNETSAGTAFKANEDSTIFAMDGCFVLCNGKGEIVKKFQIDHFISSPRREFNRIKEYVGK